MGRALIFDLDDTLYRERRFALSGFAAVAGYVGHTYGLPPGRAFAVLRSALAAGDRRGAFQRLAEHVDAGPAFVADCREVYRRHAPRLRLSRVAAAVLRGVRRSWRVAILTNGTPGVQRAKIAALELAPMVDAVVYAHEIGGGKPDPAVFLFTCARLGVPAERAVMAGDDPWCDVDGARRAGLRAIRIRQGWHREVESGDSGPADSTVLTIADVPRAAEELIHVTVARAD